MSQYAKYRRVALSHECSLLLHGNQKNTSVGDVLFIVEARIMKEKSSEDLIEQAEAHVLLLRLLLLRLWFRLSSRCGTNK